MTGTTTRPRRHRPGAGPRRRSTGSSTGRPVPSLDERLVGTPHPGREALAVGPVADVVAEQPLDVVGQLCAGDLEPAQLATERRVHPDRATEVDLESFTVVDDRALEADVC